MFWILFGIQISCMILMIWNCHNSSCLMVFVDISIMFEACLGCNWQPSTHRGWWSSKVLVFLKTWVNGPQMPGPFCQNAWITHQVIDGISKIYIYVYNFHNINWIDSDVSPTIYLEIISRYQSSNFCTKCLQNPPLNSARVVLSNQCPFIITAKELKHHLSIFIGQMSWKPCREGTVFKASSSKNLRIYKNQHVIFGRLVFLKPLGLVNGSRLT